MDGLLGRGPIGVELFFALSGFLITSLLLHERKHGGIGLRAFWIRRSLRIFPLYYLVLAGFVVHALFVRPVGPVRDHFLETVPFYATYTSNWFSYKAVNHGIVFAFAWSLAAEEQFYLVWPPILRACKSRLVPVLAMSGLVLLDQCAERGLLGSFVEEGLVLRMVRSFATPIGLGALLALANDHPKSAKVLHGVLGRRWSSLACFAAVVVALVRPWPLFETHLVLAMLVASCAVRRDHFLAPLLENRLVRHIGVVSYGIYLLNCSVVGVVRRVLGAEANAAVVFAITLVASIVVATIAYVKVERPFLALRDRFRARSPSQRPLDLASPPLEEAPARGFAVFCPPNDQKDRTSSASL